jgi:hypothetical protein
MARPSHCTHRRLPRRGVRTDTTCLKRHSSPGCHSRFRPRSTLGAGAPAVLEDPGEARRAFSGCPPVLHQFRRLPRPQQLELDRPPRCRRHRVPLGSAARAAPHRSHVGCGDRRHHPGADAPAGAHLPRRRAPVPARRGRSRRPHRPRSGRHAECRFTLAERCSRHTEARGAANRSRIGHEPGARKPQEASNQGLWEHKTPPSKLTVRVRFPSPAPIQMLRAQFTQVSRNSGLVETTV